MRPAGPRRPLHGGALMQDRATLMVVIRLQRRSRSARRLQLIGEQAHGEISTG